MDSMPPNPAPSLSIDPRSAGLTSLAGLAFALSTLTVRQTGKTEIVVGAVERAIEVFQATGVTPLVVGRSREELELFKRRLYQGLQHNQHLLNELRGNVKHAVENIVMYATVQQLIEGLPNSFRGGKPFNIIFLDYTLDHCINLAVNEVTASFTGAEREMHCLRERMHCLRDRIRSLESELATYRTSEAGGDSDGKTQGNDSKES